MLRQNSDHTQCPGQDKEGQFFDEQSPDDSEPVLTGGESV
jgi:hypothetical protein